MTTEQIIILAFLAAAFLAGWAVRSLVELARRRDVGPAAAELPSSSGDGAVDANGARGVETNGDRRAHADVRDQVRRAIRAYHGAIVHSLPNGDESIAGARDLERLAGALVALSRAVGQSAEELRGNESLRARLERLAGELRTLGDEVMVHARGAELPPSVLDRLEQHLISAASTTFAASGRGAVLVGR
jgi:hypothetical protein